MWAMCAWLVTIPRFRAASAWRQRRPRLEAQGPLHRGWFFDLTLPGVVQVARGLHRRLSLRFLGAGKLLVALCCGSGDAHISQGLFFGYRLPIDGEDRHLFRV